MYCVVCSRHSHLIDEIELIDAIYVVHTYYRLALKRYFDYAAYNNVEVFSERRKKKELFSLRLDEIAHIVCTYKNYSR